jgi:hypothetical protein
VIDEASFADDDLVMEREIVQTILESAKGCQKDSSGFKTKQGHQVDVYLGKPGNAMVVGDVQSIVLKNGFLEIGAKNQTVVYASYDAVHAISDKLEPNKRSNRSGVGFD